MLEGIKKIFKRSSQVKARSRVKIIPFVLSVAKTGIITAANQSFTKMLFKRRRRYHIIQGLMLSRQVKSGHRMKMLHGVRVTRVLLVTWDVKFDGVIHF